jgi:hypothetical protein
MSTLAQVPKRYRAYQSEHEFKNVVQQWKVQMDKKHYQHVPLVHQTYLVRFTNTFRRLQDALGEIPNPFADSIRSKALNCAHVVEAGLPVYAAKLAQGDWLGATVDFLKAVDETGGSAADTQETQNRLYDHWQDTYDGDSLEGLRTTIENYERQWTDEYATCYSKSINIFQSSGMGKSRLADELGKTNLEFSFVFRNPSDGGYPRGDTEITNYFQGAAHASILAASFYAAIGTIGDHNHRIP